MKFIYIGLISIAMLLAGNLCAQQVDGGDDPTVSIKIDTRFDGEVTTFGKDDLTGISPDTKSGFIGQYMKILVDGKINEKFSYNFRHRLYVDHNNPKSFFNATDWANVTYSPNGVFSLTAGKQMIFIGTIEYDYAPIDVYFASDFWNHVDPYQIGVSVGFIPAEGQKLIAQVTNSPFSTESLSNMYTFNLMWYGTVTDWFSTIYSANMIEYEDGHYINYIALGNKLKFNKVLLDVDYMNRYAGKGSAFFEDFSISGKVEYGVSDSFNIFAKGGYDVNKSQEAGAPFIHDRLVLPGVELGFYGAGVEYFPVKRDRQSLRFHAFWFSNTSNPMPNTFNIGMRWRMKVLER